MDGYECFGLILGLIVGTIFLLGAFYDNGDDF